MAALASNTTLLHLDLRWNFRMGVDGALCIAQVIDAPLSSAR